MALWIHGVMRCVFVMSFLHEMTCPVQHGSCGRQLHALQGIERPRVAAFTATVTHSGHSYVVQRNDANHVIPACVVQCVIKTSQCRSTQRRDKRAINFTYAPGAKRLHPHHQLTNYKANTGSDVLQNLL